MRIIGGIYRGRKIEVSKGFVSRPTTDFAREALFNILANHFDFESISVLDLFGGTGSISLEFASRGCSDIDLVDMNSRSVEFISGISKKLDIKGLHTVRMEVFRFMQVCKKKYNIIFADPPYDLKNLDRIPGEVFSHDLLLTDGWFILEHGKGHTFKDEFRLFDERRYGSVHFSFFRTGQL